MGTLRQVALGILLISFIVFVALFGRIPALRSTPIGLLHRCIWHQLPKLARQTDRALTGGRVTSSLSRLIHYLVNEKNPVVLIFFLALLTTASSVFIYTTWTRLSSWPHHILISLLLPLPYLFTYLSARSTSSYITPANHITELKRYPYDNTLYHPGAPPCRTCLRQKPARSKHCSICRACIARADHHCVWVNNCLGATNYKYFVALLLSLGLVLTYGAALAYIVLRADPIFSRAGRRTLQPGGSRQGQTIGSDARWAWLFAVAGSSRAAFDAWTRAVQLDLEVGAVGLLALLTAPLAWSLFGYHVYLAWAGMTTNETGKWSDLQEDMDDGMVWRLERTSDKCRAVNGGTHDWQVDDDDDDDDDEAEIDRNGGQKRTGIKWWPVRTRQLTAITANPGDPPPPLPAASKGVWVQCWKLGDLDNLYDAGLLHNIKDAFDLR